MSLILTLFVLFIIGYIWQGDNKLIYESLKKDSYNYHQIYSINLEQMNTDNITVSDTLSVLKENGENILVSEILNTGDKFVIRFNDAGCISCMQYFKKHIDYINMFISEVGAQNVICLLNSNNPRIIRSFKKQYCISCEVYGLSIGLLSPIMEVSDTVVAYYFCVLSKEYLMENCFINIQEISERTDAYFESIKRKFAVLDGKGD